MTFFECAIDIPIHKTFTYRAPDSFKDKFLPGMRAVVPFKNKTRLGYILDVSGKGPEKKGPQIKEVISMPDDEPIFSTKMIALLKWVSDYYCAPIGEVCTAALPNLLGSLKGLGKKRGPTRRNIDLGSFYKEEKMVLTGPQKEILDNLEKNIARGFSVNLLHGVTGSGKTEIYLRLMEKIISMGKNAILLVPEISLTPQLAGRVSSYFKQEISVYHSGMTETQQLEQWKNVKDGKVKIAVGTRSAAFLPFANLGLIIVDEEHDYSYKQEDPSPRYNARDTSIMRAKLEGCLVVLGSATPTIESLANVKSKKYDFFHLPERHSNFKLPTIEIVDMRKEIKSTLLNPHLSIKLMSQMEKEIKNGHQAILFLNRRGYANFLICQDCGFIPKCPNCNISLTQHKKTKKLSCHYCNYSIDIFHTCPTCKGSNITAMGSGTEMIEEVLHQKFPGARIARLDRDSATTEKKRNEILSKMKDGGVDILIGTQMVAKGHDFPNVTLVGIISAEQSIHFPDFRSGERTFQLLTQVAGRAGRAFHPGHVIIQTYSPENTSIQFASKSLADDFVSEELTTRKDLFYPPYSRLANIKISGNKEPDVKKASEGFAKVLLKSISKNSSIRLLGPAPAPLALRSGKVRWQILLKSSSAGTLSYLLKNFINHANDLRLTGVQVSVDVDPVSTM